MAIQKNGVKILIDSYRIKQALVEQLLRLLTFGLFSSNLQADIVISWVEAGAS